MKDAIEVSGLKKSYGSNMVLRGLDFQIKQGEIFALLGVNGAGKTTTLECIEGLRKYDEGTIIVNGKTGIQLQSSSLPIHIKPMEAIKLFAKWNHTYIDDAMLKALGIKEMKESQYIELSTGQKRRLHLALALISNPDIIFLDEPTAGLDVEGRLSLHEEIRKLKSQGKTIVLASHDMAEVETLCDRIAILNSGKIVFSCDLRFRICSWRDSRPSTSSPAVGSSRKIISGLLISARARCNLLFWPVDNSMYCDSSISFMPRAFSITSSMCV